MDKSIQTDHPKQNAKPAGNLIKQRIAGMAPTTLAPNDKTLHPRKLTKPRASLQPKRQKTQIAATTIRGQCRREGILNRRPPTQYNHDSSQNCSGHPTQDWQRRREIAAIKKYNSRHSDQKEYHHG